MEIIDLSYPINQNTPVFPGGPPVEVKRNTTIEKDGYEDHLLQIETHIGTHIDAPSHMVSGGKNLDEISIEQFVGQGVYVDVRNEFDLAVIKKVKIEEDSIVLFHTGMSGTWGKPEYFTNNPQMNKELAHYLVKRKVKMVGADACSVDREPYPIHKILLGNNILLIENLTNVEVLKGKNFNVYALPLKLQVDGSPARVIAEILS